jgi:hypothetical protein
MLHFTALLARMGLTFFRNVAACGRMDMKAESPALGGISENPRI